MSRPAHFRTRSKTDEHIESVLELLYDYGPHTSAQIAHHLRLTPDRAHEIMTLVKADGTVTTMTRLERAARGPTRQVLYWILKEDAESRAA